MPANNNLGGIEKFNEVTEESVIEYIDSLDDDKSINDSIPVKV